MKELYTRIAFAERTSPAQKNKTADIYHEDAPGMLQPQSGAPFPNFG